MPKRRLTAEKLCISALLVLVPACGGATDTSSQESPDQPGTTATPTTAASRCGPYPPERAEELITSSDTGQRKIEGNIVAAAAVKSTDTLTVGQGQRPIYVIAINVDGQIVVVLLESDSATGSGLYSSTDELSERATGFPQNKRIGSNSTEGVAEARACVTKS